MNGPMLPRLPGARPGVVLGLPLLALAASCGGEAQAQERRQAAPPPPAVVVAEVRSETVPIVREFVARTEAVNTVAVQARVEAILALQDFEEGRPVEQGQRLYQLDDRTYRAELAAAEASLAKAQADLKLAEEQVSVRAAEAGLSQAKAKLEKAEQDVSRLEPLAEKDAVPRQDLDTAVAAREVAIADVQAQDAVLQNSRIQEEVGVMLAQAQLAAAKAAVELAQINLEYCTIECPIDGLIGRTQVNVGNLVGRGEATVLATVSSVDPIYVTFAISEAEYLRFEGRKEELGEKHESPPVDLILADDSVFPHQGIIVTAERAVAQETGTLQVVARFPNPDARLRPGQFGRVRLAVAELEDAVLVPQRAVMEQQSAKIVLVVGEGDKVALRTVQLTERVGSDFVVADGLQAGERVIVEGQLKARPGMVVKPSDKPITSEPGEPGR